MVRDRIVQDCGIGSQQVRVAMALFSTCWLMWASVVCAQETDRSKLYEPVFRVSKKAMATGESRLSGGTSLPSDAVPRAVADAHPLDPALAIARNCLAHIEQDISDYTCMLVKRERVHGTLLDHEFIMCKVRHRRSGEATRVPFGVYLNFLKPNGVRGREVIFVEGLNGSRIVAHEGGFKGRFLPTVKLMPTSALAMRGNRYPITEIGILTLTQRLIEKGERDRKIGDCKVRLVDGAKVRDRVCIMLEVTHPERKPQFDFHIARIFVDHELNIPIRYEAFAWPSEPGGPPMLIEEYTYMDVKLNTGLADSDFDVENSKYRF